MCHRRPAPDGSGHAKTQTPRILCEQSLLFLLTFPTQVTRTLMITYVPTDIQDPEIIIKHFQ